MSERVLFEPAGKFETIETLFESRNAVASPVRKGLKKAAPNGSQEEQHEIARMRNELRALLSRPRVERVVGRSVGEWDQERKAVKLIRKEGKFQGFGYTTYNGQYLENCEALFLLELNRLEIYFNTVLVSLEQAYHLLLGQNRSREYDKYLVYSTLSRTGYIVQKFANHSFKLTTVQMFNKLDCIWEILQFKLNSNHEIPVYVKNNATFDKLKNSMESIVNRTKIASVQDAAVSCSTDVNFNFNTRKRVSSQIRTDNYWPKKPRYDLSRRRGDHSSFLNCLKDDLEYHQFRDIFEKLEMVQLKAFDDYDDENTRDLTIDFDLYMPNAGFKKTGNVPPSFRVIVLGYDEEFPSRSELIKGFRSQLYTVPLLVVSVSLSKHIQAFLYYFT